jgi:hypothetical protein
MLGELSKDPILQRIRVALRVIYGDRIERVVLFGSRARGDGHADSDYDIAVFLKNLTDRWREFHRWQISERTFWPNQGLFWRRGHFEQGLTESVHR